MVLYLLPAAASGGMAGAMVARCAIYANFSRHDRNVVTWQASNLKSAASLRSVAGQQPSFNAAAIGVPPGRTTALLALRAALPVASVRWRRGPARSLDQAALLVGSIQSASACKAHCHFSNPNGSRYVAKRSGNIHTCVVFPRSLHLGLVAVD